MAESETRNEEHDDGLPEDKHAGTPVQVSKACWGAIGLGAVSIGVSIYLITSALSAMLYSSNTVVGWLPPISSRQQAGGGSFSLKPASWLERESEGQDLQGRGEVLNSKLMDQFAGSGDATGNASSDDTIPRTERWQIFFPQGLSQGPYARQLDALGIELGVVQPDGGIEYLSEIAKQTPRRRKGKLADERRLYLSWSRGNLRKADHELCSNAGISMDDTVILRFCPPHTADEMGKLERDYAGRRPQEIKLTRFALKRTFNGYRLFVLDQLAR